MFGINGAWARVWKYWKGKTVALEYFWFMIEISVVELEAKEQLIIHLKADCQTALTLWWFGSSKKNGLLPA